MNYANKLTATHAVVHFLLEEDFELDYRLATVFKLVEQSNFLFWNFDEKKACSFLDTAYKLLLELLDDEDLLVKYFITK